MCSAHCAPRRGKTGKHCPAHPWKEGCSKVHHQPSNNDNVGNSDDDDDDDENYNDSDDQWDHSLGPNFSNSMRKVMQLLSSLSPNEF